MQNDNAKFKIIFTFLSVILIFTFYSLHLITAFAADDPQQLKDAINEKTQILQEINQKMLQAQKDLDAAGNKGKTLQNEIKQADYRINQLNLSIKSSEINIEKLGLEIKSLNYDMGKIDQQINAEKGGISQLLKEIQKKDGEELILILLKNKSLSENIDNLRNIADLNAKLSDEIANLSQLNEELSGKLDLSSQKKIGIEQENKNLKNKKIIASGEKQDKQELLVQTKNQEKNYQSLINNLEKQQEEIAAEIEKMDAELRLKIDPNLLPTSRPGVLIYPIPGAVMTQGYGATTFAKYGYKGQWHNGLDFAAAVGTPVLAAEKGAVVEVWDQDKYCYRGAYGKFIAIKHENNLTTLYAHLSLAAVKKGDSVNRGDVIGYVGKTGYSTGPHLHFTVYASQTFYIGPSKVNCGPIMPYGGDLDPQKYL